MDDHKATVTFVPFSEEIESLKAQLSRAEQERDAAMRDAGRYRYMRNVQDRDVHYGGVYAHERAFDGYHFIVKGERLDAAIDAAIVAEGREG